MLAEMSIPLPTFPFAQSLPAHIAHSIATNTGELVAATVFNEAEIAFGAGALQSGGLGGFNCGAKTQSSGFVANVRVVPGFEAEEAGGSATGRRETLEAG